MSVHIYFRKKLKICFLIFFTGSTFLIYCITEGTCDLYQDALAWKLN